MLDSVHVSLSDGFRIEGWTVVPKAHEMVRHGETAHVEPKPMEVLVYLAERAGQTVRRDELMDTLWSGVVVTDHALNRCISSLRRLFADDPRAPRVIETIPKAGYRLIAPVEILSGDSAAASPVAFDLSPTVSPVALSVAPPRRIGWPALAALGGVLIVAVAGLILATRLPPETVTRSLTVALGVESEADWNPAGTQIVYVHHEGTAHHTRLLVRDLASDAPLVLTEGHMDLSPAWSPDGTRIAFLRCSETACRVVAVPVLGGEPRQLLDMPVASRGLDWTTDGTALLVSPKGSSGLASVDLRTGHSTLLTSPPDGTHDSRPRLSPDGRTVAFLRQADGQAILATVPASGGDVTPVIQGLADIPGVAWSRDGRRLLFSSNRSGVYALWSADARGRQPAERLTGPAVRDPGGVALAGDRLVVEDWLYEINLWRSTEGTEAERVVASTLWDMHPALSPDGSRLAFVSNRTGPPELWTADASGQNPLRLTSFGGPSVEAPHWSPDGREIAFVARPGRTASVFVLSAAGGTPRQVTDDAGDDLYPRWSLDGRSLLFTSTRDGGPAAIWRIPASGGAPRLERALAARVAEEIAPGVLALTRTGRDGLWVSSADSLRYLSALPAATDAASWLRTERGLIVPDRKAGRLVLIDPVSGTSTPLAMPTERLSADIPAVAASREGASVVISRTDRVEADLMLATPVE
ncbi:MAG: winged helix-turn-helix domain-containing protein [Bacteroidota bacterium]